MANGFSQQYLDAFKGIQAPSASAFGPTSIDPAAYAVQNTGTPFDILSALGKGFSREADTEEALRNKAALEAAQAEFELQSKAATFGLGKQEEAEKIGRAEEKDITDFQQQLDLAEFNAGLREEAATKKAASTLALQEAKTLAASKEKVKKNKLLAARLGVKLSKEEAESFTSEQVAKIAPKTKDRVGLSTPRTVLAHILEGKSGSIGDNNIDDSPDEDQQFIAEWVAKRANVLQKEHKVKQEDAERLAFDEGERKGVFTRGESGGLFDDTEATVNREAVLTQDIPDVTDDEKAYNALEPGDKFIFKGQQLTKGETE